MTHRMGGFMPPAPWPPSCWLTRVSNSLGMKSLDLQITVIERREWLSQGSGLLTVVLKEGTKKQFILERIAYILYREGKVKAPTLRPTHR